MKLTKLSLKKFAVLAVPLLWGTNGLADFRLINGTPVAAGTYNYVVNITTNGAPCTASVVGPKTIITAAHCVPNGADTTFKVGGKTYTAKMTRSPLYNSPKSDHDVALGVATEVFTGVDPVSIGGTATQGLGIQLLGYGCAKKPSPGEPPQSDGILRIGETVITGFSKFDMVSRKPDGAAICFGDSGGPSLVKENNKDRLLGITTKGNLLDTNWSLRLDMPEAQTFLKDFASQNGVKICGVTGDCGGVVPPTAPKCSLSANPSVVKKGESIVFSMISEGQVTSASIDGTGVSFPTGTKSVVANNVGTFSASGLVTGLGGSGSCSVTYTVENGVTPPQLPRCTLTATPDSVLIGDTVSLELNSTFATDAQIEGVSVTVPNGKRVIQTTQKGTFTALGKVTNAVGTGNCTATYRVDDSVLPPEIPNFAVVPSYCGENVVTETKVIQVCLGVVKRDTGIQDLRINQVVIVTYADASKEIMPIMARKLRPATAGDIRVKEDLFLYANSAMGGKYYVMDSRAATLTKMDAGQRRSRASEVPTAIEGRTIKGKYFLVEKLSPVNVSAVQ